MTVFISYARADEPVVKAVATLLKSSFGAVTWTDMSIAPGSDWMSQIDDAIGSADTFLIMITRAFMSSHYCQAELGSIVATALTDPSKKIIPVYLEEIAPEELPSGIGLREGVNLTDLFRDSKLLAR